MPQTSASLPYRQDARKRPEKTLPAFSAPRRKHPQHRILLFPLPHRRKLCIAGALICSSTNFHRPAPAAGRTRPHALCRKRGSSHYRTMPEPSAIRPKNIHADPPPVDPRSGCRRPHAKGAETGSAAKANAEKRVRRRHEKTAPSVGRSGRQAMSDLMYPPNKLLGIRCRALSGLRGRTLSGFGLSARLFALLRTSTLGFLLSGRLLGSRLVVGRVLLGLLGTCNRTAHHHHCCQCCQCLFHGLEILEGLTPFIVRAVVRNPFRPKKDQAACRR